MLVGVSGLRQVDLRAASTSGRSRSSRATSAAGWSPTTRTTRPRPRTPSTCSTYIAGKRLRRGLLTVVDATNVQQRRRRKPGRARQGARRAARRDRARRARGRLHRPERRHAGPRLRRRVWSSRQRGPAAQVAAGTCNREGFRRVHVLHGVDEIAAATFVRERLLNDRRDDTGPFDVVGDVHGCRAELETLLDRPRLPARPRRPRTARRRRTTPRAGGRSSSATSSTAARTPRACCGWSWAWSPPAMRCACPATTRTSWSARWAAPGDASATASSETLEQLEAEEADNSGFKQQVAQFCDGLVAHLVLDDGRLVVAHAGLKEAYHGRASGRVRSFALYGDTTGETDEYGLPVRYPWADDYRGRAMVLYGHTPVPEPGGSTTRSASTPGASSADGSRRCATPRGSSSRCPAEQVWYEPVKPFACADDGPARRSATPGSSTSTTSREALVETAHPGRVKIRAENAAGALEVMSRFAVDPRWLLYLPPTMAPAADLASDGPSRASRRGLRRRTPKPASPAVLRGEAHGLARSRCLPRRDAASAVRRADGEPGAVYTRTGRPFFDADQTAALLERGSRGRRAAPVCGTSSAPTGCCSTASCCRGRPRPRDCSRSSTPPSARRPRSPLPPALAGLDAAAARGVDVADLLDRTRARAADADAFTDGYRRYCRPTDGLDGVPLAPFQVLAAEGRHVRRARPPAGTSTSPTGWSPQAPDRFRPTRRLRSTRPTRRRPRPACGWWEELTAAGGEGMVVKPVANLARTADGLVQPGLEGARPRVPPAHLRPRLHRPRPRTPPRAQPRHKRVAGAAGVRPRPRGARPLRRAASRCGGCTRRCSRCSRWSRSRSTRGCERVG